MNNTLKNVLNFLKTIVVFFGCLFLVLIIALATPRVYRMVTNTGFSEAAWQSNQGKKFDRSPRERMASDVVDWLTDERPTPDEVLERLGEPHRRFESDEWRGDFSYWLGDSSGSPLTLEIWFHEEKVSRASVRQH